MRPPGSAAGMMPAESGAGKTAAAHRGRHDRVGPFADRDRISFRAVRDSARATRVKGAGRQVLPCSAIEPPPLIMEVVLRFEGPQCSPRSAAAARRTRVRISTAPGTRSSLPRMGQRDRARPRAAAAVAPLLGRHHRAAASQDGRIAATGARRSPATLRRVDPRLAPAAGRNGDATGRGRLHGERWVRMRHPTTTRCAACFDFVGETVKVRAE